MFFKKNNLFLLAVLFIIGCSFLASPVSAYQIQSLGNVPVDNDYVLLQGKNEFLLDPGQKAVKQLSIVNRLGRDAVFTVTVEDFGGSQKANNNLDFYGQNNGPYSLKDYLFPEVNTFTLKQGEMMVLPVVVEIPKDATPGGLYGAVFISTKSLTGNTAEAGQTGSQVQMITRLASLFFVRVSGSIEASGQLQKFSAGNYFYNQGPIKFNLAFHNSGSIYLDPYGQIAISDIWGKNISTIKIPPYYVMPQATRIQVLAFNQPSLFGLYRAQLEFSPGYGSARLHQSVYFVVLPWLKSILILLGTIIFAWLVYRLIILFKK